MANSMTENLKKNIWFKTDKSEKKNEKKLLEEAIVCISFQRTEFNRCKEESDLQECCLPQVE